MKVAIMQPYFFPYIGYFQLIHSVDKFVVYDDVNFIKGGWINRNFILSQGQKALITLQLDGASPNVHINEVRVGSNRNKLLKTLQQSYTKAPQYREIMPIIEEILMSPEPNLAKYLCFGLRRISDYLDITPQWVISSDLKKNNSLKGQDKVISICRELGATHYINASGGKSLYSREDFKKAELNLSFISSTIVGYKQCKKEFEPNLSIIDMLMFNGKEERQLLLKEYVLD